MSRIILAINDIYFNFKEIDMARKKKQGWGSWIWEKMFGKKEFVQHVQKMTGKQVSNADQLGEIVLKYAQEPMEKIGVPEVPSNEQLMPGGTPQIEQPQFRELPEFDFSARRAQAEKDFATQDIPALAERFSSLGKGVVSSPGFAATMARAQGDFRSKLLGIEEQMGQKYNLQRGDLESRQAAIGLQGQALGAAQAFKGGGMQMQQAMAGLKRADLQSILQQRRRPGFNVMGGAAFKPQFEGVIRPETGGLYGEARDTGIAVLKALSKFS